MLSSVDHSSLYTKAPVNKMALHAICRGEEYIPRKKIANIESHNAIAVRKPKPHEFKCEGWIDLTGKRYGRFTVIGLSAIKHKAGGHRWVVRCDCGTFSERKAKAIKNPSNTSDLCEQCRHQEFIKRRERFNHSLNIAHEINRKLR